MKNLKSIRETLQKSGDYIFREVTVHNTKIELMYSEVLTNTLFINDYVIRALTELSESDLTKIESVMPDKNVQTIKDDEIFFYIANGFTILVVNDLILAIETRDDLDRSVSEASTELSILGPKDSFTESINMNVGLIRKRIKSPNLINKALLIGKNTSSKVALMYMEDIADQSLITEIENRLSTIDIDGIIDSSYLKGNLEKDANSLFPTVMSTERPDKVCMSLLEGKVAIIVEQSPFVLLLPNFLVDFFHTIDDYYQKPVNITFIRIVRTIAFFLAIFIPAYYIAITTHNQDTIPLDLLLNLQAQRQSVPFPALIEAFIMSISFEILRESDLRMSNVAGSAVSILGGLILGDAAVSAGIMSPIMIIVIAISAIAGLMFTSVEVVNAIRIWRIILLILATVFGLYGVYLGALFLLTSLASTNNFNRPYLAPFSPFIPSEHTDAIIKGKNDKTKYRNPLLSFKNRKRGKY